MSNRLIHTLLFVCLACQPCAVLTAEAIASLQSKPFDEQYTKEAPVSGRVIAGISLVGADPTEQIYVTPLPSAAGETICVRVMSRDGRYRSKNTFKLPDSVGAETIPLEYPTGYGKLLQSFKPEELAMLAYTGECDITDQGQFLIASRFASNDRPQQVQLFINSARSDTFAIIVDEDNPQTIRCTRFQDGRRTGYDTLCSLDLSALDPKTDHLDINIKRRQYNGMLPGTKLRIDLPPSRPR